MRWTFAAILAVAAMLTTTACQDQQARNENARLQAELNALKEKGNNSGGNDDLLKLLLADRKSGDSDSLERKLNSVIEDVNAGLSDIKKAQQDARDDDKKRLDNLENRLDKVADLEKSLLSLERMIETLEGKVKGVDPNETLTYIKEKMEAEADLKVEAEARKNAEAQAETLRKQLQDSQAEVQQLKDEISSLSGDDISKHPDYRKLRTELRAAKGEIENLKSDLKNVSDDRDRLLAQIGEGPLANREGREVKDLPENYDFSGKVVTVSKGRRPDGPSNLLIEEIQGRIPPVGTVLVVLDAKNEPICNIKVLKHYHFDEDDSLPVETVGAETINEAPTRPVAKGDRVLWVTEDEPGGSAGGE